MVYRMYYRLSNNSYLVRHDDGHMVYHRLNGAICKIDSVAKAVVDRLVENDGALEQLSFEENQIAQTFINF